jgi:hypothetical protein
MNIQGQLAKITGLEIYAASLSEAAGATYFLGRRSEEKKEKLVGVVGLGRIVGRKVGDLDGRPVTVGPTDHTNAQVIRAALPWTAPVTLGLKTSVGLGDRLGVATPGHIQAVRKFGVACVLAQQSIREMTRTQRSPEEVLDCATWGVLQEGFRQGFGADADHLQKLENIDATVAAGFVMFTVDPGLHVENAANKLGKAALEMKVAALDFETLAISPGDLKGLYVGRTFALRGGAAISFDESTFGRAAVKYGNAVAHTVRMFRHLKEVARGPVELEVSVDETESPTSPAEHYYFAAELRRLGVEWVSMAPRFVGRFEKGVDYIGDLEAFRRSFAAHVAVMRTLGPYKMSIHSGSDKFSIYPIVAELTQGLVHLKTAGTSYLEALRAVATIDPPLFREILDFARERYQTDKASYHVSARLDNVPAAAGVKDGGLAALLEDFDTREALHVTFGSVLTADEGRRFRGRLLAALRQREEVYYDALVRHMTRHIAPFV